MDTHHKTAIKYLLLSLLYILTTSACTHWSPRVNRYGLPEYKYLYQQPEKVDDGWETAALNEVGLIQEKLAQ